MSVASRHRRYIRHVNPQPTPARPVAVHAWVDVACPWCWIAKRRFEAAEAEFGGDVTLEYHSFELAPDLPADYVSSEAEFLQLLYAGTTREEAEQMMWVVRGTGTRHGLAYRFDRVQHTSTFRAHQLLHHAKAQGASCRRSTCSSQPSSSAVATCGGSMSSSRWPVRWAWTHARPEPCWKAAGMPTRCVPTAVWPQRSASTPSRPTCWRGGLRSTARNDPPFWSRRCVAAARNVQG